ncbi:MAG TPA: protein kinase [Pyrinomonadaceae bacterium]|jgi:serine/threonine protein kinase/TolB-like protein/Flp pilus assembly protein TadD|nr:protein kinase [Pyrinomonadaceae bacterium]
MSTEDISAGQTVSHYRLLSKLGEGGMGVVFSAEDVRLGREVAVKFLGGVRNRRMSRARFAREARSASLLNHPNVATVYDYGETEQGRPFIVMELLRGQTLADALDSGGLTVGKAVEVIRGVLEALGEAHRNGIIHRDVKPSNVVLGEKGMVKVLDFGLAKSLSDEEAVSITAATAPAGADHSAGDALADLPTCTLDGAVLGTPLYVSPEQATGSPVDERGDLFSVGAVLYECLAGRPAFAAPSVVEIFANIISPAQPKAPSTYNPAVPHSLDRITLKALAKRPGDRYQSAQEFLDELHGVDLGDGGATSQNKRQLWGSSLDALYRKLVSGDELGNYSRGASAAANAHASVKRRPRMLAALALTVPLLILGSLLGAPRGWWGRPPINSVAVLPFVNDTEDEGVDYLSEGLTDALIGRLGKLPGVKVISRNSVAKYRGQDVDAASVGAALGVEAVLTGSVVKAGGDMRVTVELIDSRDRSLIWGTQIVTSHAEFLASEDAISREVAKNLRGDPVGGAKAMTTNRREVNPIAYDHYLKGRRDWSKRTGDALRQAIEHFQQAIDIDPDFALAYSGLADAYVLAGGIRPKESYMRARAAAAKALELDASLGEAYATLGFIKTHAGHDWAGGEADLRRAIELSPNHATAHHWYSALLLAQGRFDECQRELKKAQELDPLSPIINTDVALFPLYLRRYDEAVALLEKNRDLFPNSFPAHYYLGWAYTQTGRYEEAAASYEKAMALSNRHSMALTMLGYTRAAQGRRDEARAVLAELQELTKRQFVSSYRFAVLYTALGDKDAAFEWANRAYEEQDILLVYVNVSPFSDALRQDPRFGELLRRMGLGESPATPPEGAAPDR